MTAAALATDHRHDGTLDLLRADVRQGYACIATFDGPRGTAWMEIRGPKGMRPVGDGFLTAEVPTLRLWVPDNAGQPLAEAAANRDFDAGLATIEAEARPHLFEREIAWLVALLGVVRDAVPVRRPRIPTVGPRLVERGAPSVQGWASCLTLGDLEAALRKAAA